MKKQRLIPVLLLKNGWLVQSKNFSEFKNLGNPFYAVKRLSEWAADEVVYLDISRESTYDLRRDDLRDPNRHDLMDILEDVAKQTLMPITIGGGMQTLDDIHLRLTKGADKISLNTSVLENRNFITQAAKEFGSQCIVVSIDVKLIDGKYTVMSHFGQIPTSFRPQEWAKIAESCGAGEILLQSIDRDGAKTGYDLDLVSQVSTAVKIPVIALGGVGSWEHFAQAFTKTKVDAVAAANIFQHVDQSVYLAKKYLYEHKYNVRPPDLILLN